MGVPEWCVTATSPAEAEKNRSPRRSPAHECSVEVVYGRSDGLPLPSTTRSARRLRMTQDDAHDC